jgi:hypothetical protein
MLIAMSVKANKAMLLVTVPGILIVAFLAFNFACHLFHLPRNVIPHQTQIVNGRGRDHGRGAGGLPQAT